MRAVRDHFGLEKFARYMWDGDGKPVFQDYDEKLRKKILAKACAEESEVADMTTHEPAPTRPDSPPWVSSRRPASPSQASSRRPASPPMATSRRSDSPDHKSSTQQVLFGVTEGHTLKRVREYEFERDPAYVKKPKTSSSLSHDKMVTSRLATAEAENKRLQSEVNNLANQLQRVTAERDMGRCHETMMSKEALHATRKHTSSINNLTAEINKLKAELAAEKAKGSNMTKEESSNSKLRPRGSRQRPYTGAQAHKNKLGPLGSRRGQDARGHQTFDDPSMENVRPENRLAVEGWLAARSRNTLEPGPHNNLQVVSVLPEPHETIPSVEEDVNMIELIPPEGPLPVSLSRVREDGQKASKTTDGQKMIERRKRFGGITPPRGTSPVALPPNFVDRRPSRLLQKTKATTRAVDPLDTAENGN